MKQFSGAEAAFAASILVTWGLCLIFALAVVAAAVGGAVWVWRQAL